MTTRILKGFPPQSNPDPGVAAGRFYFGVQSEEVAATIALSVNTPLFTPKLIYTPTLFNFLGCRVTTAGGPPARVACSIYRVANGVCTTLVKGDFFGQPADGTGDKEFNLAGLVLQPGAYALAVNTNDGTVVVQAGVEWAQLPFWGTTTSIGLEASVFSSIAFNTWPDSPVLQYYNSSNVVPYIWLRQ